MEQKIEHILQEVKKVAQTHFRERLKEMRLYGSYARGEHSEDSDIDILIVLDKIEKYWAEYDKVSFAIHQIGFASDKLVSISLMEESKYKNAQTRFIKNLQREGIRM